MPRVPRRSQLADDVCYHIMNRGHNRERVFRDDQDRLEFLARLDQAKSRHGLLLHHYCLMSNHFHLVIRPRRPLDLSRIVAGLLRSYVHYYHRRYRFVGHLWQGRFKGPAVQDGVYLLSCGRYVERNPLSAGMVKQPWEYRWSSCRHYALGETDARVDDSPEILELSPTVARRQKLWREFLLAEDPRELQIERGDWAIGDAKFRLRLCHLHGRAVAADRASRREFSCNFYTGKGLRKLSPFSRLFLSCPDANKLAKKLKPWLKKLKWPGQKSMLKRFGEYVDVNATEEAVDLN